LTEKLQFPLPLVVQRIHAVAAAQALLAVSRASRGLRAPSLLFFGTRLWSLFIDEINQDHLFTLNLRLAFFPMAARTAASH
jgi:hypothetical protein